MKSLQAASIFFAVLVVACSAARLARDYYDEVERGDIFVDRLLREMIEEQGHNYDPYYIEDSVIGFYRKVGFVNVTGEAKLHNGYIIGLRSLFRSEHCTLKEEGDKLHVRADMGAGVLYFRYSGSVKFMNMGPTISVHGQLDYVEVTMKFDVDAKTGNNGELKEFYIDDMRGMKVWITGLGPLNWAINPIISGVTRIFRGKIRNLLENKVRNHIAERLPNYRFPVNGVEIETESPRTDIPEVTEFSESITDTSVEPSTSEKTWDNLVN